MSPVRPPAGTEPLISVVICTRDRADLLKKAITSVLKQDAPTPAFEIVVVDNGSRDHTRETVRSFSACRRVRYLHEPEPGLCRARNVGWRAARGRYVAYLDDDAIAELGWLGALCAGFETTTPSPGAVGGRVLPIWQAERPAWLADEIAMSLTIVDWGTAVRPIEDLSREWLAGANFAVPRRVLEETGGFHPWLDRAGTNLLSSGDVFLQRTLMRRGYQCVYYPAMAVRHLVPASRLTQRWFARRYFWQGVSDAVMEIIDDLPSLPARARRASRRAGRLIGSPRMRALLMPAGRPSEVTRRCLALLDLGYVAGLLGAGGR